MNINLLPKFITLKICASIIAAVILTTYALFGISFASTLNAILFAFVLIILLGKFGLLFIRKFPPKISLWIYKNIFPDINGTWAGSITSNWGQHDEPTSKPVKVTIKYDFFTTKMSFESSDGLTTSELVMSKVERDSRIEKFKLYYLFDAVTQQHESTDERSHHGSACLIINYDNDIPVMKGTYWTDRNWRSNQNTAGEISLMLQNS